MRLRAIRPYIGYTRQVFMKGIAYRGEVWGFLFKQLLEMFSLVMVWTALYKASGKDQVVGTSLEEMITYVLITSTLQLFVHFRELGAVEGRFRTGDVAIDLIRPVNFHLFMLCDRLGNLGYGLAFQTFPMLGLAAVLFGFVPPHDLLGFLGFLISIPFALVVSFLITYVVALSSFWFLKNSHFGWLLTASVRFFTGAFIPLWFFPDTLRAFAEWLPFAFVYHMPMAFYLGKIGPDQLSVFSLKLALWSVGLFFTANWLWRRAVRRITVFGG